jgi:hypothetical protein
MCNEAIQGGKRAVLIDEARILPSNASLHTCIADKRSHGLALLRRCDTLRTVSKSLSSIGCDATLARAFGGSRFGPALKTKNPKLSLFCGCR